MKILFDKYTVCFDIVCKRAMLYNKDNKNNRRKQYEKNRSFNFKRGNKHSRI